MAGIRAKILLLLVALSLSLSSGVRADDVCRLPSHIPQPKLQSVDCSNKISPDSYVLALSWSPQHCASVNASSPKHHFQCTRNNFGFVVHGLWGQRHAALGKCAQPRHCEASLVSEATIRETMCAVPGVGLIQAQWQKHGSCTGMSEQRYFETTRTLWAGLRQPDLVRLLNGQGETTAGAVARAFVEANRIQGLFKEAVAVCVAQRNSLQEVLICYDLQFKFTACSEGKTPAQQKIRVARHRRG